MLDWSVCTVLPPQKIHQLVGTDALVRYDDPERGRTVGGVFALCDEVGCAKTRQVIDAAQFLHLQDVIDTAIIVTIGSARTVWADPDAVLGEVARWAWGDVPNTVHEFRGGMIDFQFGLNWVVTNYEFLRSEDRLKELGRQIKRRKNWIICDEAWAIKNRKAQQTKACRALRKVCVRATILNGSPVTQTPMDLYSQFHFLDPTNTILGVKNFTHFRAHYAVMGGFGGKKVVGYQNLEELTKRTAPYVLARATRDCWDLPDMLDPITLDAKMTDATWATYRKMRDDLIVEFNNGTISLAKQAGVKALRLAQITSGFLGGIIDDVTKQERQTADDGRPAWLDPAPVAKMFDVPVNMIADAKPLTRTIEVGREKLNVVMEWLTENGGGPEKLLFWCRFRPELERALQAMRMLYPTVHAIRGNQTDEEREEAKRALAPGGSTHRCAVGGNVQAGGASLNLAGAAMAIYFSNSWSLKDRVQSTGRIERPGQTSPMQIIDVVATGPRGQKTVDHKIVRALRAREDVAKWTVKQWRDAISV